MYWYETAEINWFMEGLVCTSLPGSLYLKAIFHCWFRFEAKRHIFVHCLTFGLYLAIDRHEYSSGLNESLYQKK